MSVPQYNRKASLIVGLAEGEALDLSALRFRFDIRRGDLQTPNSADIRVYNLAPQTSQRVEQEFTRVVIQAGYEGNYGVIFDGTIKQVRRGRQTPTDTYLDITAADGDAAYNFSTMALSLPAGSVPNDRVQFIIDSMVGNGVEKGYIPDLQAQPLPRGRVFYGMSRDELRTLAQNMNCTWSIQDGKVEVVGLNAYKPGEVPVLSYATGVVGLPEQTPNGIKVRTLLNPNVRIGSLVKLDNEAIQRMRYGLGVSEQPGVAMALETGAKINRDGLYYVMVADHMGDTRGNDWYSDLLCLAVDAAVPDPLIQKAGVPDAGPVKPWG